ncbi:hypothetical protein V8C40DRAFT_273855 [Trichoderma camerunense]
MPQHAWLPTSVVGLDACTCTDDMLQLLLGTCRELTVVYLFTQTKRLQADASPAGFGFLRLCVVRRGKQTVSRQRSATSEGTLLTQDEGAARIQTWCPKESPSFPLLVKENHRV